MKAERLFLFSSILILLFSLSACSKQEKKQVYSSTVEMKSIDINSEVAGRIVEFIPEEGSKIKKGDIIARIDPSVYEIQKEIAQINYNNAKILLNIAKVNVDISNLKYKSVTRSPEQEQLNQIEENISQLEAVKEGIKENISILEDKVKQLNNLSKQSPDYQQKLDEAKIQLNSLKAQYQSTIHQINSLNQNLQLIKKGIKSEEKSISNLSTKIAEYNLNQAEQGLKLAEENLKMSNLNLEKTFIRSPFDGYLLVKGVEVGQFVGVGTYISTIGTDEYYAKVYLPSSELSKVKIGKEVEISSDTVNEKILGKVTYIANIGEFTPRNIETKEDKQKVVFMVKIKIIKNQQYVKPGMIVDVTIY
ncbi:HlyD family secretion protein [Caldicellulosiruptoraceae bacterium PP1]